MCSLCGALGQGLSWEQAGAPDGADLRWRRRREAAATAAEVSRLLGASRVRVDAHPDFGFMVTLPTGGVELVKSLSEIWHLLDRLNYRVPDPLAP